MCVPLLPHPRWAPAADTGKQGGGSSAYVHSHAARSSSCEHNFLLIFMSIGLGL
jgi:hypothetical protein